MGNHVHDEIKIRVKSGNPRYFSVIKLLYRLRSKYYSSRYINNTITICFVCVRNMASYFEGRVLITHVWVQSDQENFWI